MAIYSCSMAINCCIWLYVPVHGCIRCSICSYCGFAACSQLVPSISCFFLSCFLISCWFYFLQFPAIPVVSSYPTFAYHSCNVLAFPVSSCNFVLFPEISCPILLLKRTHGFSSKNHVQIFAPNNLTGASSDHAFAN